MVAAQDAPVSGTTVTGTVHEPLNEVPLPLATVSLVGSDRVVFTRASGTFTLGGVTPGRHALRIRQIGFAPATVPFTVSDTGVLDLGLTRLERLAVSLSSIEVRAQPSECVGTGLLDPGADSIAGALLARLADQSDRLRAFAATYPGVLFFATTRERLDANSTVLETKTDTGRGDIVWMTPYHVGQVEVKSSAHHVAILLPTAAQISSVEFVAHHCARYAGTRALDGETLDVLELAPTSDVRSADVAGTVWLTPGGVLRRTELRLTGAELLGFGPFLGHIETLVVTTRYRPILGGSMSLPDAFIAVQEVRSPIFAGHRLTRLRDTHRTLGYRFAGSNPAADTAATAPR